MNWTDQQPVRSSEPIAAFYLTCASKSVEVERIERKAGYPKEYRVTFGNLFGSESVIVPNAHDVLLVIGAVSRFVQLSDREKQRLGRPTLPASAQLEPRKVRLLARFVIRPTSDGRGDLILGALMKEQGDDLRPNRVYELQEIMGVVTLADKGPAAIGTTGKDSQIAGVNWCCSVDYILGMGSQHLLTAEEITAMRKRG